MRKLFTAKPGKMKGLFLLLGIVALQWSFTTAGTGDSRAAYLLTDTSTTPVAGKTVAARNKPAVARSNRNSASSKPVLASNLESETVSFGSPTGGPETEVGIPGRKTTVLGGSKAVEANNSKSTKSTSTEKKNSEGVSTNTTGTKNEGVSTTKSAIADKKTVEGANAKADAAKANTANTKNEGALNTKTAGTRNAETVNTNTTGAKNEGTRNAETVNTSTTGVKNESASTTKSAVADKKTVEGLNTKADGAKVNNANTTSEGASNTKSAGIRNTGLVNTTTTNTKRAATPTAKNTNKKTVDDATTNTKLASFVSSKSEDTKAGDKTIDGAGAILNIKDENAGTVSSKTRSAAAGTKTTTNKTTTNKTTTAKITTTTKTPAALGILSTKLSVYDSLHLKAAGLSKNVFALALKGMSKLLGARHIKDNLLAIVDYSQPSNKKRLYVIDLNNYQLLYNTFVAHGMNTGKKMAQYFSNKPSSNKSSLGFYITGPAYNGTNGYSLKLTGVEKGINDHALDRGIVIHGADYVCEGLIETQGFIGRSWGCPAVAQEVSQELIDLLKNGSCLFIYHPSPAYKAKSAMLR